MSVPPFVLGEDSRLKRRRHRSGFAEAGCLSPVRRKVIGAWGGCMVNGKSRGRAFSGKSLEF